MTVEDSNVIDFVSTKAGSERVVLVISDHLDWSNFEEDNHIRILQQKIYRYLDYIDSGEIEERYSVDGKQLVIQIVGAAPPSPRAVEFLKFVKGVAAESGVTVELSHINSA